MTRPTNQIIEKAVNQAKSCFTSDVMPCSFIGKNNFVVSVVNVRDGQKILIDYTFSTKTGKLLKSKTV